MKRAMALAWVCCTLSAGCASSPPFEPQTYVVRPHDTLYGIAWRHDVDYRDLARWNNIGPDFRLAVGQTLMLAPPAGAVAARSPVAALPPTGQPPLAAPTKARPPASPPVARAGPGVASTPARNDAPAENSLSGKDGSIEESGVGAAPKWEWPTDRLSAPRSVPGGGILLLGRLGQDVRAAGSGRVVYAGNGLRGYGNLLIIKHGENLLSAYAHNNDLLVHEGQDVSRGQLIAHMGMGPHQVCALYFEIRINGRPTDPMKFLEGVH